MTVDFERLGDWMDAQGLPGGPIGDVTSLGGGSQNVLVRFSRGGQDYVLRCPPEHKRANSDETMRREARVLAALASTDVPHPRLVAACGDVEVLGSAFTLMEHVEGSNPREDLPPAYVADRQLRHSLGLAMADGAAAIGAVDFRAVGLSDLGRADGYLERQVPRWRSQLDSYRELPGYPGPDIPGVEAVGEWLERNRPATWSPGLIHGDYHLGNVLCAPDRPRLLAIVDWELTTIGDPLVDLGALVARWPGPDGPGIGTVGAEPWDGFPTAEELTARYAERSARDVSAVAWYVVLSCYKLGIILEGTYARALSGQAPMEVGNRLHSNALALFARARSVMASA